MKSTVGIAAIAFTILALNGPALGQNGWEDDGSVVRLTTSTDKVGIGTGSPSGRLEIVRTTAEEELLTFGTDRPWAFGTTGSGASAKIRFKPEQGVKSFEITDYADNSVFRVLAHGAPPSSSQVLLVEDGGNVGIGPSSPASKLHINSGELIIQSSVGTASDATLKFRDDDSGDDQWRIAIDESQSNKLYFFDDANSEYRMVIQQDGNVGIGTTNPGQKLDIVENANAVKYLEYNNQNTGTSAGAGVWVVAYGNNVFMRAYGDNHTTLKNLTENRNYCQ